MDKSLKKIGKAYQDISEAKTTIAQIEEIAYKVDVDEVSRSSEGSFVLRKGYFYHPSADLGTWASNITLQLKNLLGIDFVELDRGDEWKPFKGGAPLKKQSHYWVKIKQK